MHRNCRADRLADRRREIGGQPEAGLWPSAANGWCGGPAALACRRLRPHSASRIYGRNFIWKPGAEVELGTVDYQYPAIAGFSHQPADHRVPAGAGGSRHASTIPQQALPIIDDLRAEGVTDYVALPLPFVGGTVNGSSWTTKQPGGFTDEQLAALRSLVKPLARWSRSLV
jgi:hypothetical protein